MNPEFWHSRWQEKRIGFNQATANALLVTYFHHLNVPVGGRIFVPLCGKSIDMVWLVKQGHDVIGVELVETAVQEFFAEQQLSPTVHRHPDNPTIKYYQASLSGQTITLWVADIFALSAKDIGSVDAVYDKAALIALPDAMRPSYCEQISKISANTPQLLITLNYDQSKKKGPPFSIGCEQVEHHYRAQYCVTHLANEPATIGSKPLVTATEQVWLLNKPPHTITR